MLKLNSQSAVQGPTRPSLCVTSSARADMPNMVSYAISFADRTPSSTSTVVESNDSTAKRQASPSTASDLPGHVVCVRRGLESQGISKDAYGVILQSWTAGTINQKQYNKPWREWTSGCDQRACSLFQAPVNLFTDLLLEVCKLRRSYSTVKTHCSAISATIQ